MVFKKISDLILSKSNSYKFYQENYQSLKVENEKNLNRIKKLEEENKKQANEIKQIQSLCKKYEKDKEYLESLLMFEIETIEKYMFELVEMNKKN